MEEIKKLKILIVDDEGVNRTLLETVLTIKGVPCHTASSGLEAINMTKKSKYDVILMDIKMPEMDGFTATNHIRKTRQGKSITIIAQTAYTEVCENVENTPFDGCLLKPINVNKLMKKLSEIAKEKGA